MMTPFEVFRDYIALKNHFNTKSYDYFKYKGRTSAASTKSFDSRKDKVFFMKLAKHKDPKNFLIANFVGSEDKWIGNLAYNEQAQKTYTEWLKRQQSLTYIFEQDVSKLHDDFNSNFLCWDGQHPYVLKLFLRKQITFESLVILCDLAKSYKYWQKTLQDDPVWQEVGMKIKKYQPFLNYDESKLKNIVLERFRQDS